MGGKKNYSVKRVLIYSEALTFRILAGDTNIFASSHDAKSLETLFNVELIIVKHWCYDKQMINTFD